MNVSDQIIQVIEHLGQKFGIAINWSSENLMPIVEELCTKYISYEIMTSKLWLTLCLVSFVIIGVMYGVIDFYRAAKNAGIKPILGCEVYVAEGSRFKKEGKGGGYHHLVNWGTNSCFVVLGKKKVKRFYDKDGNVDCHEVVPVGITLDERIADGYYYSGTMALVKELLAHPHLLEMPADTPVEYAIKR